MEISKHHKVGLFSLGSPEMNLSASKSLLPEHRVLQNYSLVVLTQTLGLSSKRQGHLLTAGQKNALSSGDKEGAKLK